MTDDERIRQAEAELFALRKRAKTKRKEGKKEYGKLATAFREAMVLWDKLKANGGTLADLTGGLEHVLRGVWPYTREWHYLCVQCDDHGLMIGSCPGDATCGRTKAHGPHEFGRPCWCDKGRPFRDKPKPSAEDFTAAGKSKPTRIGR